MRWEPRSVAARLCGVGPTGADRLRSLPRRVLLVAASGSAGKQETAGSLSEPSGSEQSRVRQLASGGVAPSAVSFLPDLVTCSGRKKLRRPPVAKRLGKTGTGGSTGAPGGITGAPGSSTGTPPEPLSLTPDGSVQSRVEGSRPALAVPAESSGTEGSAGQLADADGAAAAVQICPPAELSRSLLDGATSPLPSPPANTDSEYVLMRPNPLAKSPEYANIDSCATSCAGGDSSASGGDLPHPAADVQTLMANLRLLSDRRARTMPAVAPQRAGRTATCGRRPAKGTKLSTIETASLLKETIEQNKRANGRLGDEKGVSPAETDREHPSRTRRKKLPSPPVFGYDIDNIASFLSQATARTPANIPMVVTSQTELYVLSPAAAPEDPTIPIQLGIVVNALFKHRQWLYVQTPHSQEGYLAYSACTPLGVIPRGPAASAWDWEEAGGIYVPRPPPAAARRHVSPPPELTSHALDARVNKTDTEKLYENVTSDGRALGLLVQQHLRQQRGRSRSQSAGRRRDQLLLSSGGTLPPRSSSSAFRRLKSAEVAPPRGRLVAPPTGRLVAPRTNNKAVIWDGFVSCGRNTLTVKRGDIVILLNTSVGDWFWVKDAVGREGYIPAVCVGSGLT